MNHANLKLENPSLTLYAFHLRNRLGQVREEVTPDAEKIWQEMVKLGQSLRIDILEALPQSLICYQRGAYSPSAENRYWAQSSKLSLLRSGNNLDFQHISQDSDLEMKGTIIPFCVHDTYLIDLTFSSKNLLSLNQIHQLNPKGFDSIKTSLGQTFIFYAELPDGEKSCNLFLADECVKRLMPASTSLKFVAQDLLLGNPIFEYDNGETDPAQRQQILLWFNCNHLPLDNKFDKAVEHLVLLLWGQKKILYAYTQANYCVEQGISFYSNVEQNTQNFPQIANESNRLDKFKKILIELPQESVNYAVQLRDLKDHKQTIEINIQNYQRQLEKLQILSSSNLQFLEQFPSGKFFHQVQIEQNLLEVGYTLYEKLIESIRSIVAIDQVESDQRREEKEKQGELNLQLALAGFGVGFAVSGISSQVLNTPLEKLQGQEPPKAPPIELIKSTSANVLIHIGIGLTAGLIAVMLVLLINWLLRSLKPK